MEYKFTRSCIDNHGNSGSKTDTKKQEERPKNIELTIESLHALALKR